MDPSRAMPARHRRPGVAPAALVLALAILTSPAAAGEPTAMAPAPLATGAGTAFGVDLSLSGNPFESTVRIPVPGQGDSAALTPYLSAGATDPTRSADASSVLPRRDIEANRTSQRLDIGAVLNWNLSERLQLFGEMGFQRAREQSYSVFGLEGNRDGTYVKGGVTIRVP